MRIFERGGAASVSACGWSRDCGVQTPMFVFFLALVVGWEVRVVGAGLLCSSTAIAGVWQCVAAVAR